MQFNYHKSGNDCMKKIPTVESKELPEQDKCHYHIHGKNVCPLYSQDKLLRQMHQMPQVIAATHLQYCPSEHE